MNRARYLLDEPPAMGALSGSLTVLWHGAGGDIDEPSLVAVAGALAGAGAQVARARFPYRRKGKGPPDRMPVLLADQEETLRELRAAHPARRLFLGGRSMGGRAASLLVAGGYPADALLLLSYPLHPAGRPQELRDEHLPRAACPMLFVQGGNDALCRQDLLEVLLAKLGPRARLALFPGADHSMRRAKPAAQGEVVLDFLLSL